MTLLEKYFHKTPEKTRKSEVIAYLASLDHLSKIAPDITKYILKELKDERSHLKLIASENFTSLSVQLAMGNLLTDKYCEGYPYHRFYAGCENVDAIEQNAADLAAKLFNADHAYVQPHSGADANLVAFFTILLEKVQNKEVERLGKKNLDELSSLEFEDLRKAFCGQTLLGMSLSAGGHLTHGYRHNFSAKLMRAVTYGVDAKTEQIDYDEIAQIAKKEKPLILLAGYSAYPRLIDFSILRQIADEVNAVFMVDMSHFAGLVAGKVFKGNYNPMAFAHVVTSTTHKTLRGPRGGIVLCKKEFADALNKGCPQVLGGPLPHVIAAKAIAFQEALSPSFENYSAQIVENAKTLAETLVKKGFRITTGGTDNHLMVVDLTSFGLTGRIAETALREAGITCNRNMIPFDPQGPWYTSGIRFGTAALTTLKMRAEEMVEIADLIFLVLKNTKPSKTKNGEMSKAKSETSPKTLQEVKKRLQELLARFPLYPEIEIS